jgi:hypothetical protein
VPARLRVRFHEHLRAEQSKYADGHAPVYLPDGCLFKKGREPRARNCALLHVLQFLPNPSKSSRHFLDGSSCIRTCLDNRGNYCSIGLKLHGSDFNFLTVLTYRLTFMVAIRYILKGHKFTFYALEEGDKENATCELKDFLERLDEKEMAGLLGRMSRDADHGPPRNEEQSRDVGGDVFELKFKAIRILWFYDAGKIIICSHGFFKGAKKIQNANIARAQERRNAYQDQKKLGKPIEKRGEP